MTADWFFMNWVHTLQYERLGGFQEFLRQYLYECITIGYPAAPLEQEAISTTARLCTLNYVELGNKGWCFN
jgi:hypothetical protein